jgi:hypothetical protein
MAGSMILHNMEECKGSISKNAISLAYPHYHCSFTILPPFSSHTFPPNLCMNHRSCETAITGPGKVRMAASKASNTSRLI